MNQPNQPTAVCDFRSLVVTTPTTVNDDTRTVEVTWTTGAPVTRYDWANDRYYHEVLSLEPGSVRLDRLNSGAPVLDTHQQHAVDNVIGVVEKADATTALLRFSNNDSVTPIWQNIKSGILRNISVGYVTHRRIMEQASSGEWVYTVTDWEPYELSVVPIPADPHAQTRTQNLNQPALADQRKLNMTDENTANSAVNEPIPESAADTRALTEIATKAERARVKAITDLKRDFKLSDEKFNDFIERGLDITTAKLEVLESLRASQTPGEVHSTMRVESIRDERDTKRDAVTSAVLNRMHVSHALTESAREYRHFSIVRIAEECLNWAGLAARGLPHSEIIHRAITHTTSDFPLILTNVMTKRLRAAYEQAQQTYQLWARCAPNAPDFKPVYVTQLGAMPDLLPVGEGGEAKYGTISESGTNYKVVTYQSIISMTRELLVNDDLRAFDRAATGYAASAARLENNLVYAQLTANPTMSDGVALFHASHGNLAGSGATISATTLGAGRSAMRLQKGLNNELLNITPAFLIVPAELEQLAYQFTSSQFVPAKTSDVNEFRSGGATAITPIVDATLSANSATAWYLAANNSTVDTVEYCWLEGNEGVRVESMIDFDSSGLKIKAIDDFAAKVIDHRGVYKNAGA